MHKEGAQYIVQHSIDFSLKFKNNFYFKDHLPTGSFFDDTLNEFDGVIQDKIKESLKDKLVNLSIHFVDDKLVIVNASYYSFTKEKFIHHCLQVEEAKESITDLDELIDHSMEKYSIETENINSIVYSNSRYSLKELTKYSNVIHIDSPACDAIMVYDKILNCISKEGDLINLKNLIKKCKRTFQIFYSTETISNELDPSRIFEYFYIIDKIHTFKDEIKNFDSVAFRDEEFTLIGKMHSIFKLVHKIYENLSACDSISKMTVFKAQLIKICKNEKDEDSRISKFKERIRTILNEELDLGSFYFVCSFLNPKFKGLRNILDKNGRELLLNTTLKDFINKYVQSDYESDGDNCDENDVEDDFAIFSEKPSNSDVVKVYSNQDTTESDINQHPLVFWSKNSERFKKLAKLGQRFSQVPSSVPVNNYTIEPDTDETFRKLFIKLNKDLIKKSN